MTAPGGSVGTAYISFHARTDRLAPELEAALHEAATDADGFLDDVGTQWGETLSESTSKEIRQHGRDFADSIEHAMAGEVVQLRGVRYKVDRKGALHDFDSGEFAGRVIDDIVDGLERASRPGGPFSRVGEGISDAIGAGFNVSGKSPLITLLIFVFGALAGAITAVVQAVNGLIAVLAAVPALLTAIGLQAGVLVLAFNGVGKAISGAFAAKNWNEFYAAIQGLTPAAQNFVVTLLPLRDLFRDLKASVQQNFFTGFGNTMVNLVQQLGPVLRTGLPQLATALGGLFKQIGLFFASPVFVKFVSDIIPATLRWLANFGPGFTSFLTALIRMADATIPFLEKLGGIVGSAFGMFTSWLNEQIQSGNLTEWLDDMAVTLEEVKNLFFAASAFVASFLDALNRSGGNDVISQFTELFAQLSMFFSSEAGRAAMAGFVHLIEATTYAFSGLVFAALGLLIAFEAVLQFFGFLGAGLKAFYDWITGTFAPAIGDFFTETIPGWWNGLLELTQQVWSNIVYTAQTAWGGVIDWIKQRWNDFTGWFQEKVDSVVGFFTGLPDRLNQVGQDIMHGLWEGLTWGWDHTVKPLLEWITRQLPNWKGPIEKDRLLLKPAGKAVMDGFTEGLQSGADQLKGMLGGFTSDIGNASAGGPIVVNQNFHGGVPTEAQAYDLGRAAVRGVSDQMAEQQSQRNIRLAVRIA